LFSLRFRLRQLTAEPIRRRARCRAAQAIVQALRLRARAGELDRSKPVVCYCRSGNRSARAAAFLARAGFNALNMRGGYWPYAGRGYRVEA
jgi:rhodanese-related sulfurtransferase